MPKMGLAEAPTRTSSVCTSVCGAFTLFMFFGTLKAARMLQFVFLSLTVLFALLAIGHLVITKASLRLRAGSVWSVALALSTWRWVKC
jgi:succinate-acetate transporter protein